MEYKTLEESIVAAMELPNSSLIKYLPYILQDYWEIGSSSEEIIKLIKKYKNNYSSLNLLDLGSGKGAVSIKTASELKCKCFGIDAIDDFVIYSKYKSKEYFVNTLCDFETNDIRIRVKTLGKYDIIILGAIGPVFGNYYDTLSQLKSHLNDGGLIIIDDGYVEDDCKKNYLNILIRSELIKQINNAGMELIDEVTTNEIPGINESYENEFKNLQKRCIELSKKFPQDKELFYKYIEEQKEEYRILSNEIIPATFVIKKLE
ncbi:MAG: class I SAM-dependent methyltransferase [Treponema sp.]|jgi:SAM-dependent methyltransferase|nr:class I SAM-dependent methyltransferase [Treponema sp.]